MKSLTIFSLDKQSYCRAVRAVCVGEKGNPVFREVVLAAGLQGSFTFVHPALPGAGSKDFQMGKSEQHGRHQVM